MTPRKTCLREKVTRPWGVKQERTNQLPLGELKSFQILTPTAGLAEYEFCESVHTGGFDCEQIHICETRYDESTHLGADCEQIHNETTDSLVAPAYGGGTQTRKRICDVREQKWLFHYAALYRDFGFSVIPLLGKRPALPSWKEFTQRRASYEEIEEWFGGEHSHGIGIVSGRISGGLVVVDCDTVEDTKWWLESHPESPMMVRTGRGGLHVYYVLPRECLLGNRAKLFGRAIDLRSEAGYVVAPPSVSPITGNTYTWCNPIDEVSLDTLPKFDFQWLGTDPEQKVLALSLGAENASVRKLRDERTEKRIQNLVARLNTGVKDRSARDFAVVCGLLRQGLEPEEIGRLVADKSKFLDNPKYIAKTIVNALRAVRGP